MVKDILLCLLSGLIVGGLFAFIKLPVPAPNSIPPVIAILGITVGYMLVEKFIIGG